MSIEFIIEWEGYVCRIIDDWNKEEIYSRRKALRLEVCWSLSKIDGRCCWVSVIRRKCGQTLGLGLVDRDRIVVYY